MRGKGKDTEVPANLEDLRKKKEEEILKIKNGSKGEDDGWQNGARRKRRYKEQLEFKNKVTYFVSNLPNGCTHRGLWDAYEKYHNLMYTSVPSKKDKWGNTFGFVSFVDVEDPVEFQKELAGIKVDGRKTWMTISKFGKHPVDPHVLPPPPPMPKKSVRSDQKAVWIPIDSKSAHGAHKSYRDAAASPPSENLLVIKLATGKHSSPNEHPLKNLSLLGTAHSLAALDKINLFLLAKDGCPECVVRYIGGLCIMLSFGSEIEAKNYLDQQKNMWSKVFSSLVFWDGSPPSFERIAWLTITGIPPHLFERDVANQIGSSCGKIVYESQASPMVGNLSYDRLAVLTDYGEKINKSITISFNEENFKVWIKEDDENWVPAFMIPERKLQNRRGYGRLSILSGNEIDQFQADSEESVAGFHGGQMPVFDSAFEISMVTRPKVKDTLELNYVNIANDILSVELLAPRVECNQHAKAKNFINSTPFNSIGGPGVFTNANCGQMMDQIFGPSFSNAQSSDIAKQSKNSNGPINGSMKNDTGPIMGESPLVSEPKTQIEPRDSYQSDSDPFNLGPIIDEVMGNLCQTSTKTKENTDGKLKEKAFRKEGINRKGRKQNHTDLNSDLGAFSRFKLGRFLLHCQNRRKSSRRRGGSGCSMPIDGIDGNVFEDSCSNTSPGMCFSQPILINSNPLDGFVSFVNQVDLGQQEQQEPTQDEISSIATGVLRTEVDETIHINSIVNIDLKGFERQVEDLILEEGNAEVI
ncbi:hypothetical protein QVD17_13122 [Tagetes erecta]|uniref:RRM domain-containing protein n=1 Tax=Tagetes erecta TaxID=13708 RepID=A0AAD8P1Z2_TARER|nr:hypothetical protein QVD17_13122 [Tagetes erecta]